MIFKRFFDFLRQAFGHGRLGHPQSLEYSVRCQTKPKDEYLYVVPSAFSKLKITFKV